VEAEVYKLPLLFVLRAQTFGDHSPLSLPTLKKPPILQDLQVSLGSSIGLSSPGSITFGSLTGKPNHAGPLLPLVWGQWRGGDGMRDHNGEGKPCLIFGSLLPQSPRDGPALLFLPDLRRLGR